MNIVCKNDNYTVTEFDDHVKVSNSIFDSKFSSILLLSILEFFSPDSEMYKVPLTIVIRKNDINIGSNIVIDKKLEVHGTKDYETVIVKSEYDKWKRSYLIMNILTIIVAIAILAFAIMIVIPSDMNIIVAAVVLAFFVYLPAALIVRLCRQFKRIKSTRIIDSTGDF